MAINKWSSVKKSFKRDISVCIPHKFRTLTNNVNGDAGDKIWRHVQNNTRDGVMIPLQEAYWSQMK